MSSSPFPVPRRRLLAALCALATPALAQTSERRLQVPLGAGEARSFEDMIIEYDAVLYVIPLQQGESVRISLATNNAANCFDIYAPGSAKPVYSGSDSGNDYTLVASTPGDHVVRVYLLRFAARDGQSARYTLELRRTG